MSGNKYIIGFIDLYSGWPEAFSVPAIFNSSQTSCMTLEQFSPPLSLVKI
jgi:hypothetical protein